MGNKECCHTCTLSALCLPAGGPKEFADRIRYCDRCKHLFLAKNMNYPFVGTRIQTPDTACWELSKQVHSRNNSGDMCRPCFEGCYGE